AWPSGTTGQLGRVLRRVESRQPPRCRRHSRRRPQRRCYRCRAVGHQGAERLKETPMNKLKSAITLTLRLCVPLAFGSVCYVLAGGDPFEIGRALAGFTLGAFAV